MRFSDIPGFRSLKQVLVNAINTGHIAHAQLFAGQPGSAALPLALAYATYLNCTDRQADDSCGKCPSCVKMDKLVHPDMNFVYPVATSKTVTESPNSAAYIKQFREFFLHQPFGGPQEWGQFFGAENKQLNIAVAEARQIVSALSLKPYESEWKVMLIWLPEFMNESAANALLKILEEPMPQTLFLLVSENSNKLLATILSRAQSVRVPPFEAVEVADYLRTKHNLPGDEATTIARLAQGSIAEAERLLEEDTSAYFDLFAGWMRSCYAHKYADVMQHVEDFAKLGREGQKAFFHYTLSMLRDTFLNHVQATDLVHLPAKEAQFATRFAPFVHTGNLDDMLKELGKAWAAIEQNGNAKIVLFDTSLHLASLLRMPAPVNQAA